MSQTVSFAKTSFDPMHAAWAEKMVTVALSGVYIGRRSWLDNDSNVPDADGEG